VKSRFSYNLFGTFFDKGLILFTSFYLTSLISVANYGKWVLFYQFVVIAMALSFAPLYSIFSRRFSSNGNGNKKTLPVYQIELLAVIIILIVSFYLILVGDLFLAALFLLSLMSFGGYNYLSLYFRFSQNDKTYFFVSLLRISLFILIVLFGLYFSFNSEKLIVLAFLICNFIVLIPYLKYFKIVKSPLVKSQEFLHLMLYGASSALMNGLDKLCFGAKFSPEVLGIYSYAIALSTASNLIVEAAKKVIVPDMYKDYASLNKLSLGTRKLKNKLLVFIFVIQVTSPFALYHVLKFLGLIKIEYYQYDSFILVLFLNSISFANRIIYLKYYFYSFLHFIFIHSSCIYFSKKSTVLFIGKVIYLNHNYSL